jgi:putative phage-type endonuclease
MSDLPHLLKAAPEGEILSWHAERMTGVGGSDASVVLGLSPWKTPFELYKEKRGEAPIHTTNTAPTRWGRYLEPAIRQAYADTTGQVVRVPTAMLRHPEHNFMLANLDGFTDNRRVVEIKTARNDTGWGEEGSDQIPQAYLLQVQHYMAVTRFEVADVAVLIGGSDFRLYEVPADKDLQDFIIDAEAEFWSHVQRGEPPEPVSYRDVIARYGYSSRDAQIEAPFEVLEAIEALQSVRRTQLELSEAEETLKAKIMLSMGDTERLCYKGQTIVTWKATKPRNQFDTDAFKAAHPSLYAEFIKTTPPSRRFLLKNAEML